MGRPKGSKNKKRKGYTNIPNNFRKKQRKIIYYEDFPTYGKTKQLCDKCKGEQQWERCHG